jgi:hypothetical protein
MGSWEEIDEYPCSTTTRFVEQWIASRSGVHLKMKGMVEIDDSFWIYTS